MLDKQKQFHVYIR